jgi:hypothetical protein
VNKNHIIMALLLALSGCATMAPGAKEVRMLKAPDAASCTAAGAVYSIPPYILPNDDLKQLKNQAIALGANAVLVTGPRVLVTRGIAYRCPP